ncbi:hypothetical protein [Thermobifida halotolerans]|uniref:hypothetical protein n=1 Tax=Thermobifida halotolerans TaxID=483545 RepID=UPI00083959EA|nr:hypothetical protein [Thermobifida halotolerans]
MIVTAILACEVLFWVLLLGGPGARRLLRMRRSSTVLLLLVPVLDVILLLIIAGHLKAGGHADAGHGLGALDPGFTAAYGHSVVAWADAVRAPPRGRSPAAESPPVGAARPPPRDGGVAARTGRRRGGRGRARRPGPVRRRPRAHRGAVGVLPPLAVFTVINTVVFGWDCVAALPPSRRAADREGVAG